jgi:hypothetical protein
MSESYKYKLFLLNGIERAKEPYADKDPQESEVFTQKLEGLLTNSIGIIDTLNVASEKLQPFLNEEKKLNFSTINTKAAESKHMFSGLGDRIRQLEDAAIDTPLEAQEGNYRL